MSDHGRKLSVIGLGYVGLPVAATFAAAGQNIIGFDISTKRIKELKSGHDRTGEVENEQLKNSRLVFTHRPEDLTEADFHIVAVPTPITSQRTPDLGMLLSAAATVGKILKKGDIVVFESTVYPGATEEDCVPVLEAESGLKFGEDFEVGYSPERINPGDKVHRFETITKVVSGSTPQTLETVAAVYASVVEAGVHKAPSIKVAEAAKVIENTQRDLNIALMNELSLIFDRMDIRTADVLAAAGTKWNFLKFTPGLVGGHCIGVDPYYLTAKAEKIGYHPEVILAGRRTNDSMGSYVARKLIKMLIKNGHPVNNAKVGLVGLTFKEDVPDLRNSRVIDIIQELCEYDIKALVYDPVVDAEEAREEYGVQLARESELTDLQALILAVPHHKILEKGLTYLTQTLVPNGILIDMKSRFNPEDIPENLSYWSM